MIKLAVSGALGRMGQRIIALAKEDKDFEISALLERKDHPQINEDIDGTKVSDDNANLKGSDVLIEFTTPAATIANLKACLEHNIKMVIGTTGLSEEEIKQIEEASKKIPIVFSSNMSVGVNILFKLTEIAAEKTKEYYTINMSEAHHVHKKDAPSGTAKTLAKIAEEASGNKVENIESIRENEIVGDHTIVFESNEDILTISHHAKTRDIFVKGSLIAAKFLEDKKSGPFHMQEILGLK